VSGCSHAGKMGKVPPSCRSISMVAEVYKADMKKWITWDTPQLG
jgi:hypothetical protein